MNLEQYFENTDGFGILVTANEDGRVNGAVYGRPHMMDDGTVAFIMRHRRSYQNLLSNPHAAYIFVEKGDGYMGRRVYLTKSEESDDVEAIEDLRRKKRQGKTTGGGSEGVSIVYFSVDEIRPLVGDGG